MLILDEPFSGLDPFNVELFCKKLCVVTKGKVVLEGYLKDIKEQFRKKNIIVEGDIDIDKIKKIKGVLEVIEKGNSYQIKIESKEVNDDVFKVVSKSNNITKYALEEPSLEEIFVAKVGEAYEK